VSIDITTKEGWNSYLEIMCKRFTDIASEGEMRMASCSLVLTANPETGEACVPSIYEILLDFHGNSDQEAEELKNRIAMTLRAIATAGCCIGSIFSSEAWMSTGKIGEGKDPKDRPMPRDDPERKEGIFLSINHADFGTQSRVSIIDVVDGKRSLQDWEIKEGVNMGGRFGSFVPPDGFASVPEIVATMREGIRQLKLLKDIVPIEDYLQMIKDEEASVH
jgi:hypothetical protein